MFKGWITKKEHITGTEQMKEKLIDAVFGGYTIQVDSREQWDYMVHHSDKTIQPKDDTEKQRIAKAQLKQALQFKPADHFDREAEKARAVEREERWQKEKARLHEQHMREIAEKEQQNKI